jgi:hypothetical protein
VAAVPRFALMVCCGFAGLRLVARRRLPQPKHSSRWVVQHSKLAPAGPSWVIHVAGGRSHTIVHVRFAPKATVADQNVIRRYVPIAS